MEPVVRAVTEMRLQCREPRPAENILALVDQSDPIAGAHSVADSLQTGPVSPTLSKLVALTILAHSSKPLLEDDNDEHIMHRACTSTDWCQALNKIRAQSGDTRRPEDLNIRITGTRANQLATIMIYAFRLNQKLQEQYFKFLKLYIQQQYAAEEKLSIVQKRSRESILHALEKEFSAHPSIEQMPKEKVRALTDRCLALQETFPFVPATDLRKRLLALREPLQKRMGEIHLQAFLDAAPSLPEKREPESETTKIIFTKRHLTIASAYLEHPSPETLFEYNRVLAEQEIRLLCFPLSHNNDLRMLGRIALELSPSSALYAANYNGPMILDRKDGQPKRIYHYETSPFYLSLQG